jgi:putative methionine-R-sulfoxide reductase with GAF domain
MTQQNISTPEKQGPANAAFRMAAIILGAAIVVVLFYVFLAWQLGAWQMYTLAGVIAAFCAVAVFGMREIRNGQPDRGIWSIVIGMMVVFPVATLLVDNVGLIFAGLLFILTFVVANQALPPEKARRAYYIAVVVGVVTALLELLPLNYRLFVPEIQTFIPIVSAAIVLAALFFAIRQAWESVQTKVMVALTGAILLVIAGITFLNIRNVSQDADEDELLALQQLNVDYNDNVELLADGAAMLSISLAEREDIKELFLADDRDGLLTLLTPMFENLKENYDIRHLYVIDTQGVVYVRVHNPQKFGDDVTYRRTADSALQTQSTVAGVEIGPSRLGIRSVSPLYDAGKFIGMVEVGLDYDQAFIEEFKTHTGADYTMWVTNAAAAPAGLGPTDDAREAPLQEMFFYASTFSDNIPIAAEIYQQVLESGESVIQYVELGDTDVAVLVSPMFGYGDRIIGVVDIIQDRETVLARIQGDLNSNLITAGIGTLIGLVAVWFAVRNFVLQPLARLSSVAERQLSGDLDARVEIKTEDEFGQLGEVFNNLTDQLEQTIQLQERTIANRTRALETSTEVSRRLSTILDPTQLVREVVEQLRSAFGYYHAHIYLFDESKQNLDMVGGTGEAGQTLLARGHKIESGQGLVGRAAVSNEIVLIPDVGQAEGWLPNPLLPETKAEVAVPIAIGADVLGVLDVQHNVTAGLTETDADLIQSIANQVAIAIQNAQAYTRAQRLAVREAQIAAINQRIQSAVSIDDVLKVAVSELGRTLGSQTSVELKVSPQSTDK